MLVLLSLVAVRICGDVRCDPYCSSLAEDMEVECAWAACQGCARCAA